jgi:hypothetical protein
MEKKREIGEVISEMMSCLDTAVDRLHDVAELLDLTKEETNRLKKNGVALETVVGDLKKDFRSLSSLSKDVQEELDPYLR